MATSLRELLLSVKVKVDKDAVKQTDAAFDRATKSAQFFENGTYKALAPLKKIGEQLATNLKLSERLSRVQQALLPAGALPGRAPEAPSNRRARALREAFSSTPTPPRPGQGHGSMAAPDVSAFMVPEAAPDFRSGGQKALGAARDGLASIGRSAQVGMAQASAAVDRFNARFDGTIRAIFSARTALAGFAIVIAGTAVGHFINDVVQAGAELHTMANRTRVSVETLQVWRDVAAGVNADAGAVTSAFTKLSRAMTAAGKGGKAQAAAFKDLGVQFKGRSTEDVLIDVGAALANMDDDAKASALSMQLLGPAGAALVPAFKDGAAAVRKLTAELRENVVFSAQDAARLEEVGSAVERGEKKWTALKQKAIVLLLPVLETLSRGFEKGSKWILRMAKETSALQTIFVAITGGALARLLTGFWAFVSRAGGARAALALLGQGLQTAAGFALRFIAPLLIIEDFLTFLAGGKSLFGRAFEEIFGAGGAKEKRQEFLAFFEQLSTAAGSLSTALGSVMGSELFKGAAKTALEAILAVLNLIGLALADNTTKADAMASSLRGHLEKLGLAPSKADLDKQIQQGMPEDLGGAKREPESGAATFARKAMNAVFGDPLEKPGAKADAAYYKSVIAEKRADKANHPNGMIGPPVAPRPPLTLNDQRKIEIIMGGESTSGEQARTLSAAVDAVLTKDRRQTLSALQ
jgi:hypothetical protein